MRLCGFKYVEVNMIKFLHAILLSVFFTSVLEAQPVPTKKILWYGGTPNWTNSVAYLDANIATVENAPFNGVNILTGFHPGTTGFCDYDFAYRAWDTCTATWADLLPYATQCAGIPFSKFTDNFASLVVLPETIDWFDSFANTLNNITLLSRFAATCNMKGIFLDTESYGAIIAFQYANQPQAGSHTLNQYKAQVFTRGQEVMNAIEAEMTDPIIMTTVAYTNCISNPPDYELLPSFLDGMLDAADPGTLIYDGFEEAYHFNTRGNYEYGYGRFTGPGRALAADTHQYDEHMRLSFGNWLNYGYPGNPWSVASPDTNYFTPVGERETLTWGLTLSDRYVWVFSNKPDLIANVDVSPLYFTEMEAAHDFVNNVGGQ